MERRCRSDCIRIQGEKSRSSATTMSFHHTLVMRLFFRLCSFLSKLVLGDKRSQEAVRLSNELMYSEAITVARAVHFDSHIPCIINNQPSHHTSALSFRRLLHHPAQRDSIPFNSKQAKPSRSTSSTIRKVEHAVMTYMTRVA